VLSKTAVGGKGEGDCAEYVSVSKSGSNP
jgi:hypothetical protein